MHFSADVSRNVCEDVRMRIEAEMIPESVEVVSQCLDMLDYLTVCEFSSVSSAACSDIDDSILNALRKGI